MKKIEDKPNNPLDNPIMSNVNAALIYPSFGELYGRMKALYYPTIPLNTLILANVIRKNNGNAAVFDFQFEKQTKEFFRRINEFDIIGVYCTTPNYKQIFDLLGKIKAINYKIITIVGGPHPTTLPEDCLKHDFIDFIIHGEGEITFLELVKSIAEKKPYSKIKGIGFKNNGKIIINPKRDLIENLDLIPFPAWDLINLKEYSSPIQRYEPVADIITSRGCPYQCVFCYKDIFGSRFRTRSAKNVLDEIELLNKKYGAREIHIVDDSFNINKKRVMDICRGIKERNLKFAWASTAGIRVDTIDEEMLTAMKKAGCYYYALGIESADPNILKLMSKGITIEMQKKAIALSNKLGFETCLWFIIGFPYDTKESIEKTINFAKRAKGTIKKFSVMTPWPGTKIYDELKRDGRIIHEDWSKYLAQNELVFRPYYLTPRQVYNYWNMAYRKTMFSPMFILRKIKTIRTWVALKRNIKIGVLLLYSMFQRKKQFK